MDTVNAGVGLDFGSAMLDHRILQVVDDGFRSLSEVCRGPRLFVGGHGLHDFARLLVDTHRQEWSFLSNWLSNTTLPEAVDPILSAKWLLEIDDAMAPRLLLKLVPDPTTIVAAHPNRAATQLAMQIGERLDEKWAAFYASAAKAVALDEDE